MKKLAKEKLELVVTPRLGEPFVHQKVSEWGLAHDAGPVRVRVVHDDGSRTFYNWQHILSIHETTQ